MNTLSKDSPIRLIFNGLITGSISTILFNPLDRALFLKVKESKPLFTASLWKHPYQGVSNAIYSRVIGYGIFFSLSDLYKDFLKNRTTQPLFWGSLATATTTVILCQPTNVIKLYRWNHYVPGTFISVGKQLLNKYGWKVMTKSIFPTFLRDGIFSGFYIILSERFNPQKDFTPNLVIASAATALSSPINYYRNRQFYNFDQGKISLKNVMDELAKEIQTKPHLTTKIHHVVHHRFNIGFGTLRVGLGIAVANKIYDSLKKI